MSDTDKVKDLLASEFSTDLASNTSAKNIVADLFTKQYTMLKAVDATDSTATAATVIAPARAVAAGIVAGVFLCPSATITGSSTNNATFTVKAYPAAGVTGTTVATYTTTATISAFASASFTLATTAANLAVVQGGNFTLEVSKAGTGYTLPVSSVQIVVRNDQ